MEFTQEMIDGLVVNEVDIMKKIAEELNIRIPQVGAVISLVNEGCTIPFISRYRKEAHGSLDEVQVRDCDHKFKSYSNLENRRLEIIRGVFAQNKLTEHLYNAVMDAKTLTELEDLWAPFKKKKKTRGMVAQEKGLEPLADLMLELSDSELEEKAKDFVKENAETPELSVASVEDALAGAKDIIAERVSQESENRAKVLDFYLSTGTMKVKGVGDDEAAKTSVYQMYWDYEEALNQIKPHRILAINRGEREGQLEVSLNVDVDGAIALLKKQYSINNKYHAEAVEDGLVRLLSPAVVREIRSDEADTADDHGIGIFSENLKNLLMTQPIKGTRVLGVDPGIRTGTKCAALDETGKYLGYFVINQVTHPEEAAAAIRKAILQYKIQLVSVGNGTGTKEVQAIVSKVISENFPEVMYTVTDEDGASVYSASDTAREEFPDLDLTIRGAISIGRRLQDPLAELVKIDPKSIGVGLYQHDVNQKKLSETLDEVVGSVVNNVGVNLNTASASLLKYVSGINGTLAKKIVAYRDSNGKITNREELKKISGLGPKAYEQCAGFMRISGGKNPLDGTGVHPESYDATKELLAKLGYTLEDVTNRSVAGISKKVSDYKKLATELGIGELTLQDIVKELEKPARDPREDMPKPILRSDVLEMKDLTPGMVLKGTVRNVIDFGAFVDIGVHQDGLVHISRMSTRFIKHPSEVVKVGDVVKVWVVDVDVKKHRIALTMLPPKAKA